MRSRAALRAAAAVSLLPLSLRAEDGPALPGWIAPQDWPARGITKQQFRSSYGDAWDAVSATLGSGNREREKRRKRDELEDLVGAHHRKMPLQGSSADTLIHGPSTDWVSDDRSYWSLEQAYRSMHNGPYLLNEPGHAGQPIFTAQSGSRFGADPVTFRHELDRIALLRKLTYTAETDIEFENDHMLPQRVHELQMSIATSYSCQEYPSRFSTNAEPYYQAMGEWTAEGRVFLSQAQLLRRLLRLSREDGAEDAGARAVFSGFDSNGDGDIDTEELRTIIRDELEVSVPTLSVSALTLVFQFIDDDRSGAIDADEFVSFMLSGKMSCGAADLEAMKEEIDRLEARLEELRKRPHDEQGMVPFEADAVFDEADGCKGDQAAKEAAAAAAAAAAAESEGLGLEIVEQGRCGDHLLTMEELNDWAEAAYARGQHPASAREGSLRKAELIDPEGASSMAPAPGTCAEAVLSACPGTQDEECTQCVREQHGNADFRGACPTWALVTEACAAGTAASDVWGGIVRHSHWVEQAGVEKVLDQKYNDRVSVSLEKMKDRAQIELAESYINKMTAEKAAAHRRAIVNQFVSQEG